MQNDPDDDPGSKRGKEKEGEGVVHGRADLGIQVEGIRDSRVRQSWDIGLTVELHSGISDAGTLFP